jgi:hypothetical protein
MEVLFMTMTEDLSTDACLAKRVAQLRQDPKRQYLDEEDFEKLGRHLLKSEAIWRTTWKERWPQLDMGSFPMEFSPTGTIRTKWIEYILSLDPQTYPAFQFFMENLVARRPDGHTFVKFLEVLMPLPHAHPLETQGKRCD